MGENVFSADMAYVKIVGVYGLVGTLLFLLVWFRMLKVNKTYRNDNPVALCNYLFILDTFLINITGSYFCYFSWAFFPLILTLYVLNVQPKAQIS